MDRQDVATSNWFPGTLKHIYQTDASGLPELTEVIAAKELVGRAHDLHPSGVKVLKKESGGITATFCDMPGLCVELEVEETATGVAVTGNPQELCLDPQAIKRWWQQKLGVAKEDWFGNELYGGLLERFVGSVVCEDLPGLMALAGQSVLFLGNHETQIESLLITILASVLTDTTVITMANAKHETGWVGELVRDLFSYPGLKDPENIVYFRQTDRESMFTLLEDLKTRVSQQGASLMVHAPGTRATAPKEPVTRLSSVFLDLAVELNLPIVPLGFSRGLPTQGVTQKQEFPWAHGAQRYRLGSPILPHTLQMLPYAKRRQHVLEAINAQNLDPEPWAKAAIELDRQVTDLHNQGVDPINATLWSVLHTLEHPGTEVRALLGQEASPSKDVARWLGRLKEKRWPGL